MGSLFLTRILRLRGEPAVKTEARDCVTSFRFLLKPAYVKQVTGLFTVLKIDVKIRFG